MKFGKGKERVYQFKCRVFELLGDLNRAEVAARMRCSPTSLSHYVTSAKWWPRKSFDELVAVVVDMRGSVDDELLGRLEVEFSAAERMITPTVHETSRLRAEIQRYVTLVEGLRQERDDLLLRQSAGGADADAADDDPVVLRQRISELEGELREAQRQIGLLKRQLAALERRAAESGDSSSVLEGARYAADEVARIADPAERRERALDAVVELGPRDGAEEFIGHLRARGHDDDAEAVLDSVVRDWPVARVAEFLVVLDERAAADAAGEGSGTDGPGMRALLSAAYRRSTASELRSAVVGSLGFAAFGGVVHVLHAREAAALAKGLLTRRAAVSTVEGMACDADSLQQHALGYLGQALRRPPQEIADLVVALRDTDQDQRADWLLDAAGRLLPDGSYEQLKGLLLAAGRIHDLRSLLSGHEGAAGED
ncbi:hypothetical protein [Streptomyces sp. NBC_00059]|uniref:hypothetical protein n=1 Tax=Streptomyces sp. NBC_00059 TaxID=2975635 RepID=UPI00224F45F5|nr:hypothetical protein [Streptomyces sp. NBC_00059]MCX5412351.1 hypothetical protein [Streptomyces sp. NBC_00059]